MTTTLEKNNKKKKMSPILFLVLIIQVFCGFGLLVQGFMHETTLTADQLSIYFGLFILISVFGHLNDYVKQN